VVKQHDCLSETAPPSAPVQEAVENPAPAQAAAEEVVGIVCREDESYDDIIEKAAVRYDVDVALVKAIIMAESGYNPRAVSTRGAMGLMQLMPRTAEALGVEDGFNPEQNIDAGVRYFRSLMNAFNEQTRLALAAYNAGPRKVREYSGVPPFSATRVYIEKVFRYYRYFKDSPGGSMENV
ncbi:MAG TPA: lytic transglycosylase domain-containing protein, partial [Deltaproteobacteria bacterium]|nr:lytic transglycosylase domain-containing protein [Deltaproteobacteria bacterium]